VGRALCQAHGAGQRRARLFPAGFSLFVVAGLCTPSYLWLEPKDEPEAMGWACLAAAVLGLALWGWSLGRAARTLGRSFGHVRECRSRSREMRLPGERRAAWAIDRAAPSVMLVGVFRPRLVISRSIVAALSAEQLAAVIRHERAHALSHDNFKRLLALLAPGILPGLVHLERGWAKLAEWAADDRAAGGSARASLSLASALVRVARLGSAGRPPGPAGRPLGPLATALLAEGADLSERVDRLLDPARRAARRRNREPVLSASGGLLLTGALLAVLAHPVTLHSAHELLELLIQ